MAPTAVRLVLVEGENGDGALVDEEKFDVAADPSAATANAAEQVISAILGTRQGAAEGGYQLTSTGVTWRDPDQAAALRDALADRKIENVMRGPRWWRKTSRRRRGKGPGGGGPGGGGKGPAVRAAAVAVGSTFRGFPGSDFAG